MKFNDQFEIIKNINKLSKRIEILILIFIAYLIIDIVKYAFK